MTARRVYTGVHPVVFMTGNVGPVGPGQEFSVPDEHLDRFDARPDVMDPAGGTPEGSGQDDDGQDDGGSGEATDPEGSGPPAGAGQGRRRRRRDADDNSGEGDLASPASSEA
jgi:hypothetical protein